MCDKVEWSIKMKKPAGKYEVKVTAGDAEKKNVVELTVNGKHIFKNAKLDKNQFTTNSTEIQITDGNILIESTCDPEDPPGHCAKVWSRMNTVEITELPVFKMDPISNDDTINLGC
jgi:hypothetical protein